ncbi:hypothetical protein IEQ34_010435 [Dendrobium chrysotoxum]|uniref:Uncharacterized protein n=1 Tax=Dendrobium chrysotoxum TaxID=161865 RepID=A0AAV7H5Q7_DENCH|nr:hypothetical protein IEQ34_010435 [Dendrobium chrysotoxum]
MWGKREPWDLHPMAGNASKKILESLQAAGEDWIKFKMVKIMNIGTVLQVGDDIARIHGLDEVMAVENASVVIDCTMIAGAIGNHFPPFGIPNLELTGIQLTAGAAGY